MLTSYILNFNPKTNKWVHIATSKGPDHLQHIDFIWNLLATEPLGKMDCVQIRDKLLSGDMLPVSDASEGEDSENPPGKSEDDLDDAEWWDEAFVWANTYTS